jgi:capsular exopolysaccharide synthesis family protein
MKDRVASQSVISLYDKESPSATEFRRMLSRIAAIQENDKKIQTLLITSATVGEGKSITSSFLAITAAALNRSKVAIIDLDLRRPKIQDYFGIGTCPGVVEVLIGKSDIKSVSRPTTVPNLTVITAGKPVSPPSDILDQADIPAFLQELKFYFDIIIIDSPPLIPVSDPMMFADKVDGVVMVVRSGSTQKDVVRRASNLLANTNANLLGIILNDCDSVLPYYYKERYYGYHYSYSKKSR